VAGQAAVELYTGSREVAGVRQLDAEEVTLRHTLAWASDHDPAAAMRLTLALAPWWRLRGRLSSQAQLLVAAVEYAEAGSDEWCSARMYLGQVVGEAEDLPAMLEHLTAVRDAILIEAGDLAAAEQACAAALAPCREVGDQGNLCGVLWHLTILNLRTGHANEAAAHLRELLQIATQAGLRRLVQAALDCCGQLCATTGRPAEAVTAWSAMFALTGPWPPLYWGQDPAHRDELRRQAEELLGPARAHVAAGRGAAMSLATATEYALLLAAEPQPPAGEVTTGPEPPPDGAAALARLSPRERELVTLVAQGRTDAQIAAQLYITLRTVSSHLDRVRDKTGCRRRADLTRLALSAGLV
jgi:DNA-binding CsgD family transcriptional regulator